MWGRQVYTPLPFSVCAYIYNILLLVFPWSTPKLNNLFVYFLSLSFLKTINTNLPTFFLNFWPLNTFLQPQVWLLIPFLFITSKFNACYLFLMHTHNSCVKREKFLIRVSEFSQFLWSRLLRNSDTIFNALRNYVLWDIQTFSRIPRYMEFAAFINKNIFFLSIIIDFTVK